MIARRKGNIIIGITLKNIWLKEEKSDISAVLSPTIVRKTGAIKATERLLIIEKAAVTEMLPPNSPATTGEEVAVAVSTQIIADCANISLKGERIIYVNALPKY